MLSNACMKNWSCTSCAETHFQDLWHAFENNNLLSPNQTLWAQKKYIWECSGILNEFRTVQGPLKKLRYNRWTSWSPISRVLAAAPFHNMFGVRYVVVMASSFTIWLSRIHSCKEFANGYQACRPTVNVKQQTFVHTWICAKKFDHLDIYTCLFISLWDSYEATCVEGCAPGPHWILCSSACCDDLGPNRLPLWDITTRNSLQVATAVTGT